MNIKNTITSQWKKAIVLGALTLAPTLAMGTQAQAAPYRSNPAPAWNNQHNADSRNDNRFDSRSNNQRDNQRYNDQRDNRWDQGRDNDHRFDNRNDNRFDPRYNDHRFDRNGHDYDRSRDNGTSSTKLLGAGVIGALLGAVLAR